MVRLSEQVTWSLDTKARAAEMARREYGSEAYLDNTDVCLGAMTVARYYTDPSDGGLVLVDRSKFAEVAA